MTDESRFANSLFIISKNKDFVGLKNYIRKILIKYLT